MKQKYVKPEAFCLDQDPGCILCVSFVSKEGGDNNNNPELGGNGTGVLGAREGSLFEEDDYDF